MKWKLIAYMLLGVAGCMSINAPEGLSANEKAYRICTDEWIGSAPAHVAAAKGFWEQEGVNVKVLNYAGDTEGIDLLKKGLFDLMLDMIGTAVGYYEAGEPVVIVSEMNWSHGGDMVIVKKGADLAQFKGKPLGVYYDDPAVLFFLNKFLVQKGFTFNDFRLIQMEEEKLVSMFASGGLGAIVNYEPYASEAIEKGNGEIAVTTASYEGCMPEGMFLLQDRLKSMPKGDLVKILRGWVKASEWLNDPKNWKEFQAILNEKTFTSDDDYPEEELKEMVESVPLHGRSQLLERNKTGGGLEGFLGDMQAFLKSNKMLKKEYKPSDLFNNEAILEALK